MLQYKNKLKMLNLSKNAFHILQVSPQTSQEDIILAREKAITENLFSEKDILLAQNTLLQPKKRLNEELSWLWGFSAQQASNWIMNVKQHSSSNVFLDYKSKNSLSVLARANYAAHLCSVNFGNNNHSYVNILILTQEELSEFDFQYEINETRQSAGVPRTNSEQLHEGLSLLHSKHIESAMNAITNAEDPGRLMTHIATKWLNDKTQSSVFVTELVRAYDRWTIPKLNRIQKNIEHYDKIVRDNPNNMNALLSIENLLDEWDGYSQPVQLFDESKGLDERRSSEIYQILRNLAVYLSNEHQKYTSSYRVTKALLKTFHELPSVKDNLPSDIKLLKELSAFKELDNILAGIDKDIDQFALNLESLNITNKWNDQSPQIQQYIENYLSDNELASIENLWQMLRSIAIKLHNNSHEFAALVLMKKLTYWSEKYNAPHSIQTKFREDIAKIAANCKQQSNLKIALFIVVAIIIMIIIFRYIS